MLIKFLLVLSWIAFIGSLIMTFYVSKISRDYEGSLEQKIDNLKGLEADYGRMLRKLLIIIAVSLAFLIAYYI